MVHKSKSNTLISNPNKWQDKPKSNSLISNPNKGQNLEFEGGFTINCVLCVVTSAFDSTTLLLKIFF